MSKNNNSKNSKAAPKKKMPAGRPKVTRVTNNQGKEKLVYSIPECVRHYLEACINPFDTPAGACLPCDLLPLPSQKVVGWSKGTFSTGTSGFGFVIMQPACVNDAVACQFTTSASVGIASTAFSAYTNLGQSLHSNLPYPTASLTAGALVARAVAYGVRIRCTASAMSRGGTYVTGESEDHVGVATFTYTELSSYSYARRHAIPVAWDPEAWDASVVTSGPVILNELQYNVSAYGFTPGVAPDPLIIAVSSATPGMTFDFESYIHVEYIGAQVGGLKTRSHASPVGFSSVIEALKDQTTTHGTIGSNDGPTIFEKFKNYFIEEGPQLLNMAAGVGRMIAGDESGAMSVIGGGIKLIADSFTPHVVPASMSSTQRSILAPDSPLLLGYH